MNVWPVLPDWERTCARLHQAVILFAPLAQLFKTKQSHYLHLALHPTPNGLMSGPYTDGGEWELDFSGVVRYHHNGTSQAIQLTQHTQLSLLGAMLDVMAETHPEPFGLLRGADLLAAFVQRQTKLKPHELTQSPFMDDWTTAQAYAQVQYTAFTALARFRARLSGHLTPITIWPEHFDLSTLWFLDADMDDYKTHLNFGFAPYSDGLPNPYLYVYAYPYPDDYAPDQLPQGARWHTEGWRGVVVDYAEIQSHEPEWLEQMCVGIFDVLRPILG